MRLHFLYIEMCRVQKLGVTRNGLRIGNADDPSEQAIQLARKRGTACEVAETYASAWAENAGKFASSSPESTLSGFLAGRWKYSSCWPRSTRN